MKKNILIVLICVMTFVSVGCGCNKKDQKKETEKNKKTKEETVVNYEKDIVKDQQIEVFKMENTSLTYEKGMSKLRTEATNTSNETQFLKSFDIIIKDKYGRLMTTLIGYIGEEIPAGETRIVTSYVDIDISEAGSIEYKINR